MTLVPRRLARGVRSHWATSSLALLLPLAAACIRQPPGAASASLDGTPDGREPATQEQKPSPKHLYVQGRQLFDRCGEPVVLRGINEMVIWTAPEGQTFPEIAKTGANTVRVVWTVKDHPGEAQLDRVLSRAIAEKLIPIIELHDATGNLAGVPQVVEFWVRPEIVAVLKKHEQSLLLNIANEAGSAVQLADYVSTYTSAITKLRGAGLELPLMIDAPGWGQDVDTLQAAAPALMQADPQRNLLFSVHMWWSKGASSDDPGSTKRIRAEIEESVALNLPLVIGEFAHAGVGCSRSIDYATILTEAQRAGIGWLAWSWGPGNRDCNEMDMTTGGTFETLQGWGLEVSVSHPASIQKTSKIPASMARGECAVQLGG
ncbi:MAG TPA: cellulase family glycosylhydrolase [Polyangiaceae bacterium]|nr:cellulase family glycosylhydrolase [Polyangiaceae bacterium]